MTTRISSLNPRHTKANEEEKQEISMIVIIKTDIGQIVEIAEYHSVIEYKMDRITETTIEVLSEEQILEEMCDQIRIIEVKIIEVDREEIIEMIITKEEEVGLGIENIQIIPEGMIEIMVDPDQVRKLVPIEIKLDGINVGNMIILLRIVQLQK